MKWSTLIGLLVAALGIGTLCLCGPHSFGPGLRYIRNPMDSWPRVSFLMLDVFAALLMLLSYFLYRARNWARLVLMSGCICFTILAVVGGVALGVDDANLADDVYITGILILTIAGPIFLTFILRQPEVVSEFHRPVPNKPAAGNAGIAPRLAIGHHRPGVPEPDCSA
jgi:hypothetical protein